MNTTDSTVHSSVQCVSMVHRVTRQMDTAIFARLENSPNSVTQVHFIMVAMSEYLVTFKCCLEECQAGCFQPSAVDRCAYRVAQSNYDRFVHLVPVAARCDIRI